MKRMIIEIRVNDQRLKMLLIVLKLFHTISIREIVQNGTVLPPHYADGINRLIRNYKKGKITGSEYDLGIKLIIKLLQDETKIEQKRKKQLDGK